MSDYNLKPVYNPNEVEDRVYRKWLDNNSFKAGDDGDGETFTIVIPPPNVTGALHMGHALDNTLQDVLIRWRRMQGLDTLWLPGTDHAGIATQIRVEEDLKQEGLNRHDLGREAFIERVWEWKDSYHKNITEQLYKLGVSCDWSRERFTLDEGCSRAVQEVFINLYRKGLIYRGDYMINWCPRCHTALSDIEVEHEEEDSTLTYVKYPVTGSDKHVIVATTRPETMLGDTAVAVHPEDDRYRHLVGKTVTLPLMDREIPVVSDEYVDPSFGSGVVKITPGHDPNDWELGNRHQLEIIRVLGDDAHMTDKAGPYKGMERYDCRKKILEDLQELGLIEKIEEYRHAPGRCQRCRTVVEPLVSRQWFVKMKPLAEKAAEAVRTKNVQFVPERFTNVYLNWVDNIRDWCISRQIWWGHRIPAWYCTCGETIVDFNEPESCPACGGTTYTRDPDVLDTWFSSALWPFSTLGWPDKTTDLERFFPTSVLVTGYDIIYFWVARMIMMSLEFMKEVPFHTVYIHGLVRDAQGRKMSKSLGNGVDPLEIIDQFGADTLRFTLVTGQAPGSDQRFRQDNVEAGRNFANKLWNASRYILMNLKDDEGRSLSIYHLDPAAPPEEFDRADRWIIHRYNKTVSQVTALLEEYELGEAARLVYEFLWNDFCDWYLEFSKLHLYGDISEGEVEGNKNRELVRGVLLYVLEGTLKLLHPFMPFITEEIWGHLPGARMNLVKESWPLYYAELDFSRPASLMEAVQDVVKKIRNLRGQVALPPSRKTPVIIRPSRSNKENKEIEEVLQEEVSRICRMASVSSLTVSPDAEKPEQALTAIAGESIEIFLPLDGVINIQEEIDRLKKERDEVAKEADKHGRKLANQDFMKKAPSDIIEKVKGQHRESDSRRKMLDERIEELAESK